MAYMSTRKDSNYDLQLDNKGCWNVYTYFDMHMDVEHHEGDCLRDRVWPLNLFYLSSVENLNRIRFTPKVHRKQSIGNINML